MEENSTILPPEPEGRRKPGIIVLYEEAPWLIFGNPGETVAECHLCGSPSMGVIWNQSQKTACKEYDGQNIWAMCCSCWVSLFPITTHLPNWVLRALNYWAKFWEYLSSHWSSCWAPSAPIEINTVNMQIFFFLRVPDRSLNTTLTPMCYGVCTHVRSKSQPLPWRTDLALVKVSAPTGRTRNWSLRT